MPSKNATAEQVQQDLIALGRRVERLEQELEAHAAAGEREAFDRVAAKIATIDRDILFQEAQLAVLQDAEMAARTDQANREAEKQRAEFRRQAAEVRRLAGDLDKHFAAAAATLRELKSQAIAMNSLAARRAIRAWNVTASAAHFGLEDFLEMRRIRVFHRAPLEKLVDAALAPQLSEGRGAP
jgi:chromosome segregation ATPase